MAKAKDEMPRRRNRAVGVGEAIGAMLDPMLKKRGFASRDLIDQWQAIVPHPFGEVTRPDRLHWPRQAHAEGATLYLRCDPAHALAVSHEGHAISQAVNRYFGYVLVQSVKLSMEPFTPRSGAHAKIEDQLPENIVRQIEMSVDEVEDDGLKSALHKLGIAVMKPRRD